MSNDDGDSAREESSQIEEQEDTTCAPSPAAEEGKWERVLGRRERKFAKQQLEQQQRVRTPPPQALERTESGPLPPLQEDQGGLPERSAPRCGQCGEDHGPDSRCTSPVIFEEPGDEDQDGGSRYRCLGEAASGGGDGEGPLGGEAAGPDGPTANFSQQDPRDLEEGEITNEEMEAAIEAWHNDLSVEIGTKKKKKQPPCACTPSNMIICMHCRYVPVLLPERFCDTCKRNMRDYLGK